MQVKTQEAHAAKISRRLNGILQPDADERGDPTRKSQLSAVDHRRLESVARSTRHKSGNLIVRVVEVARSARQIYSRADCPITQQELPVCTVQVCAAASVARQLSAREVIVIGQTNSQEHDHADNDQNEWRARHHRCHH